MGGTLDAVLALGAGDVGRDVHGGSLERGEGLFKGVFVAVSYGFIKQGKDRVPGAAAIAARSRASRPLLESPKPSICRSLGNRASGVPFVPVERENSRGRLRLRASSAVLVTPGGALTAGWQQMEQVETHGNGAASAGGSDT